MSQYADKILAAALAVGMKSAEAAVLTYREVAALAGVELGKNGESPEDFVYIVERHQLSQTLAAAEAERLAETLRTEAKKALDAALEAAGPVAESIKAAALKQAGLTELAKNAETIPAGEVEP